MEEPEQQRSVHKLTAKQTALGVPFKQLDMKTQCGHSWPGNVDWQAHIHGLITYNFTKEGWCEHTHSLSVIQTDKCDHYCSLRNHFALQLKRKVVPFQS